MNTTREQVNCAVAEFCATVVQEPLLYFSEADLQQLLVEELRKIEGFGRAYRTKVPRGFGSKGTYETSLIHREYGGGGGTRIDVVVFDPADVRNIDDPNLMIGKDYLRPMFAFELGTEKTADTAKHFANDMEKLNACVKDTGYIIHFYKDTTVAPTGTARRGKTEAKIERLFRSAFSKQRNTPKVKIIPILIHTGHGTKKMWGKCEVFDGPEWRKVNVGRRRDLRNAVLNRLRQQ